MNTAVIMRNSKARTFLYVLLASAMMFTVFLLSSTHTKLKDTQESHEKCQQQRDSLSAQLQVVYEHKSRLEKTLQSEALERKKADEALQRSRDDWEKYKQGAQQKANDLERKLEEIDKTHQEEFGNLKSSYNSLQQEKEKLEADLAHHVVRLQQERDAHISLNKEMTQLRELKQKRDITLDAEVKKMQSQLETCRTEQALLQVAVQQLKSVQGPHVVPHLADAEKFQNIAASDVQRVHVAPHQADAQKFQNIAADAQKFQNIAADGVQREQGVGPAGVGAVPQKPDVKEEREAQKYGEQNQLFGAERQPRKENSKASGEANSTPKVALPVARKPPEVNKQVAEPVRDKSSLSTTTTTTTTMRPIKALADGAAIPQGAAPPLKDRPRDQYNFPLNPIQPEAAAHHVQIPAEKLVEQPAQQIAQPAQLVKPMLPSAEALLPKPIALQAPRAPGGGQADKDLSNQEQPPLQAPVNEIGEPDEDLDLPKEKDVAVVRADDNQKMQVRPPVPKAKVAHGEAGGPQAAAGGDPLPLLGAALDAEVPPKPVNGQAANAKNGNIEENLLWGGARRNGVAFHGGRHGEEDNQEYPNQGKDDDAAEDQEDDGPFGAAGDAAQEKHFPDAADFDDQAAEGDVQQPNHGREEGMMVNPK